MLVVSFVALSIIISNFLHLLAGIQGTVAEEVWFRGGTRSFVHGGLT